MRFPAKIVLAVFALALLASAPRASGRETKELPSYFPPGMATTKDPVRQMEMYLEEMNADWGCFQGNPHGMDMLISGPNSLRREFDLVSTSSATKNPAKLTVVLDHYKPTSQEELQGLAEDNKITLDEAKQKYGVTKMTLCGIRYISEHQADIDFEDIFQQVKIAAGIDNGFWAPAIDRALRLAAENRKLDYGEFKKVLDRAVPGTKGVSYREYNLLPRESKSSDFVPRELHLGYNIDIPGILGVAWLNTGLVYYNPQARIRDYIVGFPGVLAHEMMHNNINLQSYPLGR